MNPILEKVGAIMDILNESAASDDYNERHGIEASGMLTVVDDEMAAGIARLLAPRVAGKIVVEIGAGLGMVGCHLGRYADRVFCIEANPIWSWVFAAGLYHRKPKNVSFLLGAADEFTGIIRGDVAFFCTHSGIANMRCVAGAFAPVVIDVYSEMIAAAPDKFHPVASFLRNLSS